MQVSNGNHSYVSCRGKLVDHLHNKKGAALQGLPNKKGNIRPYIAFSDTYRYKILVTVSKSILICNDDRMNTD